MRRRAAALAMAFALAAAALGLNAALCMALRGAGRAWRGTAYALKEPVSARDLAWALGAGDGAVGTGDAHGDTDAAARGVSVGAEKSAPDAMAASAATGMGYEKSAPGAANSVQNKETASHAAYAETPDTELSAEAYPSRRAEALEVRFLGDAECIAFLPRDGALPRGGQSGACAIDRATAFRLFGSARVVGERVRLRGEAYRIVGVLDVDRALVLAPARLGDMLDRVAQGDADGGNGIAGALERVGTIAETSADREHIALWGLLALLPAFLAAMGTAGFLPPRGGLRAACRAALAGGGLWLFAARIPTRFFPNRWADFEFYADLPEQMRAFTISGANLRGAMMLCDRNAALGWGLAACAAAVAALWMARRCAVHRRSDAPPDLSP